VKQVLDYKSLTLVETWGARGLNNKNQVGSGESIFQKGLLRPTLRRESPKLLSQLPSVPRYVVIVPNTHVFVATPLVTVLPYQAEFSESGLFEDRAGDELLLHNF
jgi:hypothetical protein